MSSQFDILSPEYPSSIYCPRNTPEYLPEYHVTFLLCSFKDPFGKAVMDQDAKKWRGVIMDAPHRELVRSAVRSSSVQPILVKGFEELLAA